ncbi:hypothetical protein [Dactylosporangium sp. CA-233914]|uniref:hypothetical protein n=1 Tax=Dactylosporangium sp. CA-233914 TaxID=3239934 RepID=UPI003D92A75E
MARQRPAHPVDKDVNAGRTMPLRQHPDGRRALDLATYTPFTTSKTTSSTAATH